MEELDEAALRQLMDVMFFAPVNLVQAVLPGMRERQSGSIVQISSMGGQVSMPGFGAYCAAKFALEGLSDALAAEVAPHGIHVLIVEPGAFATSFGAGRAQQSPTAATTTRQSGRSAARSPTWTARSKATRPKPPPRSSRPLPGRNPRTAWLSAPTRSSTSARHSTPGGPNWMSGRR